MSHFATYIMMLKKIILLKISLREMMSISSSLSHYMNFVSKSVRRPCVRQSVRLSVCPSVTFLVNASPGSNFKLSN